MSNFKRVLLATDFSTPANNLPDCLFEICPSTDTEVVLVHVLEDGEDADPHSCSYAQTEIKLKHYETSLRKAGYEDILLQMPCGEEACKVIDALAKDLEVDLVLLASHGKGFIRSTLLGSTTFDLARMAQYPVFIEKQYSEAEEYLPLLKRVMVPTDFSKESLLALNVIRNLREHIDEVVFVHVIEKSRNAEDLAEQLTQAEQKLAELVDEIKIFGVTGLTKIAKGTASKKLQKLADKLEATLIVMTKTGGGLVKGLPMGSTAQNLALNSDRPMLLLPVVDDI